MAEGSGGLHPQGDARRPGQRLIGTRGQAYSSFQSSFQSSSMMQSNDEGWSEHRLAISTSCLSCMCHLEVEKSGSHSDVSDPAFNFHCDVTNVPDPLIGDPFIEDNVVQVDSVDVRPLPARLAGNPRPFLASGSFDDTSTLGMFCDILAASLSPSPGISVSSPNPSDEI